MLLRDEEVFAAKFKAASAFLRAAHNRLEHYRLAVGGTHSPYQRKRLEELSLAPSCNEPWYLDQIAHDTNTRDKR